MLCMSVLSLKNSEELFVTWCCLYSGLNLDEQGTIFLWNTGINYWITVFFFFFKDSVSGSPQEKKVI